MLYTSLGGTTYPWGAPRMIALLAGGLAMLIAFAFAESRAQDPILPFSLFRRYNERLAVGFVERLERADRRAEARAEGREGKAVRRARS